LSLLTLFTLSFQDEKALIDHHQSDHSEHILPDQPDLSIQNSGTSFLIKKVPVLVRLDTSSKDGEEGRKRKALEMPARPVIVKMPRKL
jgi:hypothetical protein